MSAPVSSSKESSTASAPSSESNPHDEDAERVQDATKSFFEKKSRQKPRCSVCDRKITWEHHKCPICFANFCPSHSQNWMTSPDHRDCMTAHRQSHQEHLLSQLEPRSSRSSSHHPPQSDQAY